MNTVKCALSEMNMMYYGLFIFLLDDCVGKQCYPDNDCTVNLDTLLCKCDDGLVFFGDNDRCVGKYIVFTVDH